MSPITPSEKGSSRHLPSDRGHSHFSPRVTGEMTATTSTTQSEQELSPGYFCKAVSTLVVNPSFPEKHKAKMAPLAVMAFAETVAKDIIERKKHSDYFTGVSMTVPPCPEACNNQHYHCIVGTKFLHADWEQIHGVQVPCPDGTCRGILQHDRSNCSKNKTLFLIFNLEGPPSWCIFMKLTCRCCRRDYNANEGDVLVNLPDHLADEYPVETNYAFKEFSSHLLKAGQFHSCFVMSHGRQPTPNNNRC